MPPIAYSTKAKYADGLGAKIDWEMAEKIFRHHDFEMSMYMYCSFKSVRPCLMWIDIFCISRWESQWNGKLLYRFSEELQIDQSSSVGTPGSWVHICIAPDQLWADVWRVARVWAVLAKYWKYWQNCSIISSRDTAVDTRTWGGWGRWYLNHVTMEWWMKLEIFPHHILSLLSLFATAN